MSMKEHVSEPIIIAISGRKNSGKNTLANFAHDWYPHWWADRDVKLFGAQSYSERYSYHKRQIFECSFADNLKEFCINTLGLSEEQCYGSDNEKNTQTEYLWSKVPKFFRWKFGDSAEAREMIAEGTSQEDLMDFYFNSDFPIRYPHYHKDGYITGREMMQLVGTDLIRQTLGNVWAGATVRRIKKSCRKLALITDNRFPNEIEAVLHQPYGFIIRLTRSPFGYNDIHPSESALDHYDWNRDKCFILDNKNMNIEEQNEATKPIFNEIFNTILDKGSYDFSTEISTT